MTHIIGSAIRSIGNGIGHIKAAASEFRQEHRRSWNQASLVEKVVTGLITLAVVDYWGATCSSIASSQDPEKLRIFLGGSAASVIIAPMVQIVYKAFKRAYPEPVPAAAAAGPMRLPERGSRRAGCRGRSLHAV